MCQDRANAAVIKNFRPEPVSLKQAKRRAVDLCGKISLAQLAGNIKKAEGLHLRVFFSAKTHKEACPFRAIVTERGTWQRQVAAYLQKHLSSLSLTDPFLVRNSEAVVESLRSEKHSHHEVF
ncbi:unnamed protein product [Ixodes hexagonus]